jgi:hypothetical protein
LVEFFLNFFVNSNTTAAQFTQNEARNSALFIFRRLHILTATTIEISEREKKHFLSRGKNYHHKRGDYLAERKEWNETQQ